MTLDRFNQRKPWLMNPPKLGICRYCLKLCKPTRIWHDGCVHEYWTLTIGLRDTIFARDKGVCVDCGRYDERWEAEHEIPLADGGPHTLDNIVTRCLDCHRKKTSEENSRRARMRRLRRRGRWRRS